MMSCAKWFEKRNFWPQINTDLHPPCFARRGRLILMSLEVMFLSLDFQLWQGLLQLINLFVSDFFTTLNIKRFQLP